MRMPQILFVASLFLLVSSLKAMGVAGICVSC